MLSTRFPVPVLMEKSASVHGERERTEYSSGTALSLPK